MFSSFRFSNALLRGHRALLEYRLEKASGGFLLNLPALSFFLFSMIQFGPGLYLDMNSENAAREAARANGTAERLAMDYLAQWDLHDPARYR